MQTEQDDMPLTIPTPVCADHTGKGVPYSTTSALKKERYRMRKCFLKAGKRMSSLKKVGLTGPKTTRATMTPESKKIKENLNKQLKNLQEKRDKKSIANRRLLLETHGWQLEPQQHSPYKRIKQNPSTLAAVQFMEDQSVFLPCKRSVLKKTGMQKKVLPKQMKRLHRDFLAVNRQKLLLHSVYRHRLKHIKTSWQSAGRNCHFVQSTDIVRNTSKHSSNRLFECACVNSVLMWT